MKCPKCHSENPDNQQFCGGCGTKLLPLEVGQVVHTETIETSQEELVSGSVFAGRYQVIEELGKGGMGKVYRVLDKKLHEEVALKLIKPEIASDKKTLERFKNELKLARKVAQKHVGKMFDLGEETGTHYITMEYVPGEDLKSSIRRFGQLPIGKSISIAKQICEGLAEAHSIGIVHRDLKPSNIMIDKQGNARIMDFGIARSLKGKGVTGAGVIIGTPEYMSPEQVDGKETDQRSDIYSLGIILYEMLTGQLPFEGETPLSIAVQHRSDAPKDPKKFNAQIPDDLSSLVLKCLEKDAGRRYQSASEIYAELSNIEGGIPTTDRVLPKKRPTTSREITVSFSMKKYMIPILSVIAIAIIGLFLWRPWAKTENPLKQTNIPSIAVLPFEDISLQKDQEHLCYGIAASLRRALSNINELRIPAIGSTSSYEKESRDYKAIAELLNVDFILDGTLQKEGDTLRVIPELIKISDGNILWSETYDKKAQDILDIQDYISSAIVDALKVNLLAVEKEKVFARGTENLEAYDQYQLGRFYMAKRTEEGLFHAYDYFNKAIELDPNYALAYVGLADAYLIHPSWGTPVDDFKLKAEEAVTRALELDANLAEAHTSLAWIKFEHRWDWEGAEREFKRAIELNPNYETGHQWYAEYLSNMGRFDEARKEIDKALELAPLSLIINVMAGFIEYQARQYDKAILQYKKTLAMDPNFPMIYRYLQSAYFDSGMYAEFLELGEELLERGIINEEGLYLLRLFCDIKRGQRIEEGVQLFEQAKTGLNNYEIADGYSFLGEIDQCFIYLNKACDERDLSMRFIKVNPHFDVIRDDPRYKEILRKMNLE